MASPLILTKYNQASMLDQPYANIGDITYRADLDQEYTLIALPSSVLENWAISASRTGGNTLTPGAGISISSNIISSLNATNSIFAKAYGVTANGQFVYDAISTNNSKTITSATANFTPADVGKIVFGIDNTGANTAPVQGLITGVIDAHTITVSNAATASKTGVTLGWGTDDTAACSAAWSAAVASQVYLTLPDGYIFVQSSLFNITTAQSLALIKGLGLMSDGASILVPTPRFDFSSAPTTTSGLFANWGSGGAGEFPNYFYMANISVYGGGFNATGLGGANNSVFTFQQQVAYNIQVWNWGGVGVGINFIPPCYAFWVAVDSFDMAFGMKFASGQTTNLYSCYSLGNVDVFIAPNATVNSFGSQWGQANGTVAFTIEAGAYFNSYGEQFVGASGGLLSRTFDVSGTLNLNGGQIINSSNQYGVNVLSGGRALLSGNCLFDLSAVSAAAALIDAAGIFVDDGTTVYAAGTAPAIPAAAITPDTGWGTTGAAGNGVSAVAGDIRRFQFTITATGSPTPNPTVAIAFPWTQARTPFFICKQVGGTGAIAQVSGEASASTTSMTLVWNGTPQNGDTYIFQCISE